MASPKWKGMLLRSVKGGIDRTYGRFSFKPVAEKIRVLKLKFKITKEAQNGVGLNEIEEV